MNHQSAVRAASLVAVFLTASCAHQQPVLPAGSGETTILLWSQMHGDEYLLIGAAAYLTFRRGRDSSSEIVKVIGLLLPER